MRQSLLLKITLAMLATSALQAGEDRVQIGNTPLSAKIPTGFVVVDWVHTDSPSVHFYLPKGPHGGTPGHPSLSITQVNPIREPETLDSYVEELYSNEHTTVFLDVRETSILGQRAVEIAAEWITIYDFTDGGAAQGKTTTHEIMFFHNGDYYICELRARPEIHEQWVDSLRELCGSLRQDSSQDAQQVAPADRLSGG